MSASKARSSPSSGDTEISHDSLNRRSQQQIIVRSNRGYKYCSIAKIERRLEFGLRCSGIHPNHPI